MFCSAVLLLQKSHITVERLCQQFKPSTEGLQSQTHQKRFTKTKTCLAFIQQTPVNKWINASLSHRLNCWNKFASTSFQSHFNNSSVHYWDRFLSSKLLIFQLCQRRVNIFINHNDVIIVLMLYIDINDRWPVPIQSIRTTWGPRPTGWEHVHWEPRAATGSVWRTRAEPGLNRGWTGAKQGLNWSEARNKLGLNKDYIRTKWRLTLEETKTKQGGNFDKSTFNHDFLQL